MMTSKEFAKLRRGSTVTFTGSTRQPEREGAEVKIITIDPLADIATIEFEDHARAFVTRHQIEAA